MEKVKQNFNFRGLQHKLINIFQHYDQSIHSVNTDDNTNKLAAMNEQIISLIKTTPFEQEKFFIYYSAIRIYTIVGYSPIIGNIRMLNNLKDLINCIIPDTSLHIDKIQLFRKFNDLPVINGRFFIVAKDIKGKTVLFISREAIEELSFTPNTDLSLQYEHELLVVTFFDLFYENTSLNNEDAIIMLDQIWKLFSDRFNRDKMKNFNFGEETVKKFIIPDDIKLPDNIRKDRKIKSNNAKQESAVTEDTKGEDNNMDSNVTKQNENKIIENQKETIPVETTITPNEDIQSVSTEESGKNVDIGEFIPDVKPEIMDTLKSLFGKSEPNGKLPVNKILEEDNDMVETENEESDNDDGEEQSTISTVDTGSLFANRQLSWLAFNDRVLEQAKDNDIPLFEQLKFLGIASNNLDEFFMVRVGSVINRIRMESDEADISGLLPQQEYSDIHAEVRNFYEKQFEIYSNILNNYPDIFKFKKYKELEDAEKKIADNYFDDKIYEALSPHVIDEEKPFPMISSKSLNIAVLLTDNHRTYNLLGIVKVPNHIPRLVPINETQKEYILAEDLIINNLDKIFINKKVKKKAIFRVVRNADISVEEVGTGYIVNKMKETLVQREIEEVVRLEINIDAKKELIRLLQSSFGISKKETYHIKTPIDLTFLMNLDWRDKKHCFPKFEPQVSKYLAGERSIFEAIDEQDIILHHPYESFQPILDFIDQAAHDPDVVAIKQTLYRVSSDSSIINSLMEAAQQGKSVTVLFEVKARFNELSNIEWAEKLERVGGHVIYGTSGLKTHCKLSIVIKKNKKGNLKPYIHLGTGNYNEKTALVYTDFSFFTSNKKICEEAVDIFNMLTGFSEPDLKRLICAPVDLRNSLVKMIQNEIDNVEKFPDKQHFITIKVNSLIDKNIIEKLYEASSKGVQINLIVRGMCLINTSLSEAANIHVRSIVGRFLEHSRIYIFSNNGDEEIYLSSADVMERNLDKRFEIMFPIKDKEVRKDIKFVVRLMLADDIKHYELNGFAYNKIEGKDIQTVLRERHEKIGADLNVEKIYY